MSSFASTSTQAVLLTPQEVTADGNSAGVDITQFSGEIMVVLTGKSNAGTNPTMACKLQHAQGGDIVTSVTPGVGNTGTGTFTQVYGGADAVAEDITVTFSSATAFAVSGSVSSTLATGTVGTLYSVGQVEFMVTAGGTAFVNGDTCVIVTAARTYADVGAGGFTGLTTVGSVQRLAVNSDKLGKYLRLNMDIGGTNSPKFTLAAGIYGEL
jgi:hypothetical protein